MGPRSPVRVVPGSLSARRRAPVLPARRGPVRGGGSSALLLHLFAVWVRVCRCNEDGVEVKLGSSSTAPIYCPCEPGTESQIRLLAGPGGFLLLPPDWGSRLFLHVAPPMNNDNSNGRRRRTSRHLGPKSHVGSDGSQQHSRATGG